MRTTFFFLTVLWCTACVTGQYFPTVPPTTPEHVPEGKKPLGFSTAIPDGWQEGRRVAGPHVRSVTFRNASMSGSIVITLIQPGDAPAATLRRALARKAADGWDPTAIHSSGGNGKYFFAKKSATQVFVGAQRYAPCGKYDECTVTIEATAPKSSTKPVQVAIKTLVTSFRFTE